MKGSAVGIFLYRINYSETSLIVHFYTREFGLKKFLFKGGKKKGHALFPMAMCDLEFYGRQESNLLSLSSAEPRSGLTFQFDPLRSSVAFFMAEVIRKCVIDDEVEPYFFDRLGEAVKMLDQRDQLQLFPLEFMLVMAELMGIQPLLSDEHADFLNLDDGVFERFPSAHVRSVSGPHVHMIQTLMRDEKPQSASRSVREDALDVLLEYFRIHVPRFDQVQSYEIVKEVIRG